MVDGTWGLVDETYGPVDGTCGLVGTWGLVGTCGLVDETWGLVGTWLQAPFSLFPSYEPVGVLPRLESSRKFLGKLGTHESALLVVPPVLQWLVLASRSDRTPAHKRGGGDRRRTLHGSPLL